jgi:hypothetical protein
LEVTQLQNNMPETSAKTFTSHQKLAVQKYKIYMKMKVNHLKSLIKGNLER